MQALHGHFTGTVDNICWLAPELLSQDLSGYSFQSDVYSVGIAALELATGEAPFAGLPVTEVRYMLCVSTVPSTKKHGSAFFICDFVMSFLLGNPLVAPHNGINHHCVC